jgi:hypothetical protein
MKKASILLILFSAIFTFFACSTSDEDIAVTNSKTGSATVPEVYKKI